MNDMIYYQCLSFISFNFILMEIQLHRGGIDLQLIQGRGRLLGAAASRANGVGRCALLRFFNGSGRGVALIPLLNLYGLFQVCVVALANILLMGLHVIQNLGLQRPPKKVQLSNRGHELLMVGDRKHDALAAAVWVKILLRIRLQLAFVTEIHKKLLAVEGVANEALTTVFSNEPVNDTKTKRRLTIQINKYFINITIYTWF